jgi:catechol-2,3-dioxygenase
VNEKIPLKGVVLDAPDPRELADFYCRLLGWEINSSNETWVTTVSPPGSTKLSFQYEPNYRPPTWPSETDKQQMMLHLDFQVQDLEAAHQHALAVGARPMEWQPQPDVRVYADPVGHVFCFFT